MDMRIGNILCHTHVALLNERHIWVITSPVGAVAKYCGEYVSVLSVCLSVREDISGTTHAIFTKFFVDVAYDRGSVLWQGDEILRG